MTPVVFYRPSADTDAYEAVSALAAVRQGSRADFEEEGAYVASGGVRLTVPSGLGVRKGWLVEVSEQIFRVEGHSPIPPFFVRAHLECVLEEIEPKIERLVTANGKVVTANNKEVEGTTNG